MNLLQQLQHLNEVLAGLWTRLDTLDAENKELLAKQAEQSSLSSAEVSSLQEQLSLSQRNTITQDEKFSSLQVRYDALVLAHETMRTDFERLSSDLTQLRNKQQTLQAERDNLTKKNEYAKEKVEAIMKRLASLNAAEQGDFNAVLNSNTANAPTLSATPTINPSTNEG